LSMLFASDFLDLFEVRGITRLRRGRFEKESGPDRATHIYRGLDGVARRARLSFDPPPAKIDASRAAYDITLIPQERQLIQLSLACEQNDEERKPQAFIQAMRAERRVHRAASHAATTVETSNSIFNQVLCRSM